MQTYLVCIAASVFLLLTGNAEFIHQILSVYPLHENIGFLLALFALNLSILILAFSLLSILLPVRPLLASVFIFSAITAYFSDHYATIISVDMIRNTLETNVAETRDLFSWNLLSRLIFLGVVPAVVVMYIPLQRKTWSRQFVQLGWTAVCSLIVIFGSILSHGSQFASFFREHKTIRFYSNPTFPIYSTVRFIIDHLAAHDTKTFVHLNAHAARMEDHEHYELIVVVVGETARADHFSLNGYDRDTNPFTEKKQGIISYSNIDACGTSTAISVPCMFSLLTRKTFDIDRGRSMENVLDILQEAGVNVLWRDNNSDSKGVATRVKFEDFRNPDVNTVCDEECRDVSMLVGLQDFVNRQTDDILIVLHQMGSHGPTYYKRYPKEFEYFSPSCHSSELSNCSTEQIVNAYDNSIRYTDYFLSKVIEFLENNTPKYETAMLYISDHGESLGEGGVYLHGMPYILAPKAQTKVPVILWAGDSSDIDLKETLSYKNINNSHDAVFDTLMNLFEISSQLPDRQGSKLVAIKGK